MDPIVSYLERHQIGPTLNGLVNELVADQPDDPISFLINGLLRSKSPCHKGTPALQLRLEELRATLLADQTAAQAVAADKERLQAEVEKLKYQVTHLTRTLDKMAARGSGVAAQPAAAGTSAVAAASKVPLGHTPFSWAGGVEVAAVPAEASGVAPAAASGSKLTQEPFSKRVAIGRVFKAGAAAVGQTVSISGWARTVRIQKGLAFIKINDGSCLDNLQVVVDSKKVESGWDELKEKGATGCAFSCSGELVASPGSGQAVEMVAASVAVIGGSDGATYPLAKKAPHHSRAPRPTA